MAKEIDPGNLEDWIKRIQAEFLLNKQQAKKLASEWENKRRDKKKNESENKNENISQLLSYEEREWVKQPAHAVDLSVLPENIRAQRYFDANRISADYLSWLKGIVTTSLSGRLPRSERGLYGWEKITEGRRSRLEFAWNMYPLELPRAKLTLSANDNDEVASMQLMLYSRVHTVPVSDVLADGFQLDVAIEGDKVTGYTPQTMLLFEDGSGLLIPNRPFYPDDFEELMKGVKMLAADIDELSRLSQNN